jgi:hypothetical protein
LSASSVLILDCMCQGITFLEDELDYMIPPEEVVRMIAHLSRRVDVLGGGDGTDEGGYSGRQATSKRMSDVFFPAKDNRRGSRMMLMVVVGPEGGWDETSSWTCSNGCDFRGCRLDQGC